MVKNTAGGNRAKGFARKSFAKKETPLRLSENELELYAQVTKVHGGANCQVTTLEGSNLLCHIRGKFRGRGKRDNFIGNGTWLLVGLRDWEKEPAAGKLANCDVIEVYSDSDKIKLKNNITTENWAPFISYETKNVTKSEHCEADNIEFADEKAQEYQELIESQIAAAQEGKVVSSVDIEGDEDQNDWIDADDI